MYKKRKHKQKETPTPQTPTNAWAANNFISNQDRFHETENQQDITKQ